MKTRIFNVAFAVVFVAVVLWLLAVDGANYLRKIEALSLFLPTREYFASCMTQPGGLLAWTATFLTQMFYHPWLGAAIYAVLLLCMALATMQAFRLPRWAFALTFIVPALVTKALLNLGYVIFSLKTPGFAFLMPLGVLAALLLCWGCSRLKVWWWRATFVVVVAACGYWAMGFYGLLAAALCCVAEVRPLLHRQWSSVVTIALAVVTIAAVPSIYAGRCRTNLRLDDKYTCQLPWQYEGEHWWENYNDDNFRLTLDLDRALWDGDWDKALECVSRHQDFEPTRLNVILTDMVLIRSGRVADLLLRYRVGSASYKTVRSLRVTHDAGAMLFSFHTGHINYAYRWAMENKVEYGLCVERLKMMVKCALLNGDYGVARKCLDNLSLTAFHKDWAAKYGEYVEHPEQMDNDDELASVRKLMRREPGFINDHGQLEGYIWKSLASMQRGGDELLELSMIATMISYEVDEFANRVTYYYQKHKSLPLYFQQALVFWSKYNENDFYTQFDINPAVVESYDRFIQTVQLYQNLSEEQQNEVLRKSFGDTYWYYCYCLSGNMQII